MSPRARACTCARCRRLARARATRVGAKRHDGTVSAAAPRIVIAAGGTAGHVVPALAVAQELRAEGAEVAFIGGARAEAELVPAAGYALHAISVEGLSRSNPLHAVRALARARAGALAAARTAPASACSDPLRRDGPPAAGLLERPRERARALGSCGAGDAAARVRRLAGGALDQPCGAGRVRRRLVPG